MSGQLMGEGACWTLLIQPMAPGSMVFAGIAQAALTYENAVPPAVFCQVSEYGPGVTRPTLPGFFYLTPLIANETRRPLHD